MINLEPRFLEEVKRILREHASDYEVRVFGSRINGRARPFSDLDIALVGTKKMDWRKIEKIKQAFSESALPFMVDVLDWHSISEEFRKVIEKKYEVLQKPASTKSRREK